MTTFEAAGGTATATLDATRRGAQPPRRATDLAAVGAAIAAGFGALLLAVAVTTLPPRSALVVLALVVVGVVAALVGHVERFLLAVILLDLPLQLDVNLGYKPAAGSLGAFAGLNVSVTTVALGMLYGGLALRWLLSRPEPPGLGISAWPFAVYVATVAASIVSASDKALAAYWIVLLLQTLLLYMYLLRVLRTPEDFQFVATILVAGLLVEALYMCWQWFGHAPAAPAVNLAPGQPLPAVSSAQRMTGTFGSPNTAGSYLTMFLPLAGMMVLLPVARALRALGLAAFVFGTFALVVTFSRGSWVTFCIAMLFVVGAALRRHLVSRKLIAVLAAAVAATVIALHGLVLTRVTGSDAGSASARFPLLEIAGRIISKHPLTGVGANNYAVALRGYFTPEFGRTWLYVVHNDYALVLAEAGIVALLAYGVFLGSIFVRGAPALRSSHWFVGPVATALVAGVLARLIHMTYDLFNGRPQVEALVIAAAMLAVAGRLTVLDRDDDRARARADVGSTSGRRT
jgi:O-antigen ligase